MQKELIVKSFKENDITLAIDGSQDKEFLKIPNEFIDQMQNENYNSNSPNKPAKNEEVFESAGYNDDNKPLFIYNNNVSGNFESAKESNHSSILDYFKHSCSNKMDLDKI